MFSKEKSLVRSE